MTNANMKEIIVTNCNNCPFLQWEDLIEYGLTKSYCYFDDDRKDLYEYITSQKTDISNSYNVTGHSIVEFIPGKPPKCPLKLGLIIVKSN